MSGTGPTSPTKLMNVLLTGGTGYIGSHVATVLCQQGHKVVLYDNLSNSSVEVVYMLNRILGQDLVFVQGDICDFNLLCDTLMTERIDAVMHFAGLKAVSESYHKPIDYYLNNVQGAISLLRAIRLTKIRKLIFSSSATVYGEPKYLPLDEKHPTAPINPYGRSKLQVEDMLADIANSDSEFCSMSLRYFNPVGAHDSGLIGEDPLGHPENLMPLIAQVASGLKSELTIFGEDYATSDGTGVRDYIHVTDLAKGHVAALSFLKENPGYQVVNLGTGIGHSVLEVVRTFECISKKSVPYSFSDRRPGDVPVSYANCNKANELLHWRPQYNLSQMCESVWKYTIKLS